MENRIKKLLEERIQKGEPMEAFYNPYSGNSDLKNAFVEEIRKFLLIGTHSNSETRRILTNITPSNLQRIINNHYIFTRFYFALNYNNELHFNYCAGQDYIAERKAMREIIVKEY